MTTLHRFRSRWSVGFWSDSFSWVSDACAAIFGESKRNIRTVGIHELRVPLRFLRNVDPVYTAFRAAAAELSEPGVFGV